MGRLTGVRGFLWALLCRGRERLAEVESLVVGLGNPGEQYRLTRHNCGFRVIDILSSRYGTGETWRTCRAEVRLMELRGYCTAALVKPLTFMNRSGESVSRLLEITRTSPDKCVVVVDDINLPVGRIRVRRSGSDGGHNGLKSIVAMIGDGFPRIRIGVGPAPQSVPLADFVLGPFSSSEQELVSEAEARAADAVICVLEEGVDAAMNKFN